MNKKVSTMGVVVGLALVWVSVTLTALATNEVTSYPPVVADRSTRTQRQVLAPDQTVVGQLFINEVSPASAEQAGLDRVGRRCATNLSATRRAQRQRSDIAWC
jgi:hypothetical protein